MKEIPAGQTAYEALATELAEAQAAAVEAPIRRRNAVLKAKAAGWKPYRMARAMNVDQSIVAAILAAAAKADGPRLPARIRHQLRNPAGTVLAICSTERAARGRIAAKRDAFWLGQSTLTSLTLWREDDGDWVLVETVTFTYEKPGMTIVPAEPVILTAASKESR